MAYGFKAREAHDFTIVDTNSNEIVGHVRIKPSGVLWAEKSDQTWHRLSIKKFGELAKQHGTKQSM